MDAFQAAPPPPLTRWQSRWRYLFAVVAGAVFWVATLANAYDWVLRPYLVFDLCLGVLSVVLMRWRRRYPLAIALLVSAIGGVSSAASGAVVVTALSLATRRKLPEIVPLAVVGLVASIVYFETQPGQKGLAVSVAFTLVFVSAVIAIGMYVGARRDLLATLRERADRAEREQDLRIQQAHVTERARIAREMHDVLAHRLSLVALHAGALEYCRSLSDDEVANAAAITRQSAHRALNDLHEILGVLRTLDSDAPPEPPQPTLVDLPALVREATGSGARVRLHNEIENLADAPEAIGRNAYRMVQESLTNARKHAPDTAVDVTLSGRPGGQLMLEVRNPLRLGAATSTTPGSGLGLLGLTERAELIGGRLEHTSSDGDFVVRAWLPWPA
ncbi:signal transduction histidine kinase [Kribbella voronezhensis]|uniref:histidine kinase n=1 Tax=Kribbella voronezhensis TaxID=2512212 RepID=A0A4R7SY72_9ACTN|nr:histidine kinase [Kribbella voronezhensis]TDU83879.1 signal transduction histidine kinase [Kribbella voronezhensis]